MIQKAQQIMAEVQKVVVGKEEIIAKVLMVMLAKGHVLIEDIPGVGKTTLALAFSKALSLDYKRIQFTPDVMPSDITGFNLQEPLSIAPALPCAIYFWRMKLTVPPAKPNPPSLRSWKKAASQWMVSPGRSLSLIPLSLHKIL